MASTRSKRLSAAIRSASFIAFIFLLSNCTSHPEIPGFDSEAWKSDKYGCEGKRVELGKILIENKEQLLEMKENAILSFLGRPDENELYTRDQKFYTYFIEPSYHCEGVEGTKEDADHLLLRFNSIGLVNDVKVVGN